MEYGDLSLPLLRVFETRITRICTNVLNRREEREQRHWEGRTLTLTLSRPTGEGIFQPP